MNITTSKQFLAVLAASTLVFAAGCSDSNDRSTVGQKVDRAADKVAASTERAISSGVLPETMKWSASAL